MTQEEQVIDYIQRYGSISQDEAAQGFGCYRLASRIYDLKSKGVKFKTIMDTGVNRYGNPVRYARYFLSEVEHGA